MKGKLHPGVAVGVILAAIGAIFGAMYVLSEAPMSKVPPGPNFGAEARINPSGGAGKIPSGPGSADWKKTTANAPKSDAKAKP
jgi:hypothetical protein